MKKVIFVGLALGLFLAGPNKIWAQQRDSLAELDYRKLRLYHFLKENNSPLQAYTDDFVEAADVWQIDWRLLPAISGLESGYGKRLVPGSHNGYGWAGGYFYFEDWSESIFYVSRKLRTNYYNKGLESPYEIGPVYAPPNSDWGGLVAAIMSKI